MPNPPAETNPTPDRWAGFTSLDALIRNTLEGTPNAPLIRTRFNNLTSNELEIARDAIAGTTHFMVAHDTRITLTEIIEYRREIEAAELQAKRLEDIEIQRAANNKADKIAAELAEKKAAPRKFIREIVILLIGAAIGKFFDHFF